MQASMLTQTVTGPRRTSNTQDLLVLQNFYWSYKFFFDIKRKKHCIKSTDNIYFLFISSSFISKTYDTFLSGNFLTRMSLQDQLRSFFTGLKPFWDFFTGLGPQDHCYHRALNMIQYTTNYNCHSSIPTTCAICHPSPRVLPTLRKTLNTLKGGLHMSAP